MSSTKQMEISSIDGDCATASADGATHTVRLDIVGEKVSVGDLVVVHAGVALHRVDGEIAAETVNHIHEIAARGSYD